ncbi:MAG: cupin domain-containing protein [Succinivibrionaceae bacterium]
MKKDIFEAFNNGILETIDGTKAFDKLDWNKHPTFEGVELKHIVSGKDTNMKFSYHLVRIAPNKAIKNHVHATQLETHEVIAGHGVCVNDGKKITYKTGVITIIPENVPHEVIAGEEGLYLFAKFMPALC